MKRKMRRLLSLLMVLVLVCSMIPAAFAAGSNSTCWVYLILGEHAYEESYVSGNYQIYECGYCGATKRVRIDSSTHSHDWEYQYEDEYGHWKWCDDYYCEYHDEWYEEHSHSTYCIYCDYGYGSDYSNLEWNYSSVCYGSGNYGEEHDAYYDDSDDYYDYYYCYYCNDYARVTKGSNVGENGLYVEQYDSMANDTYEYGDTARLYVDAYLWNNDEYIVDGTSGYTFIYEWSGDIKEPSTNYYAYLDTTKDDCDVSCKVTVKKNGVTVDTVTVNWYARMGAAISVEATVYNTNTGYALGDVDDEGNTSVAERIADAVNALGSTNDDYVLDHVVFSDRTETGGYLDVTVGREYDYDYDLEYVTFTPTATTATTVEFPFTAYYYDYPNTNTLYSASGTITFTVKEGGKGPGIVYTALNGENVALDEDDFVEFWEEVYPYGTLDSVSFSVSSSKGSIYDAYGKRVTGTCYYDPTGNQTALDGLTFDPASSTAGTIELGFKAYGSTRANGSTSTTNPLSGTITILYTAEEVTPIEYLSTGSYIDLDPADFIAKYKEVMDVSSTVNGSSLTIQFLEAPTYGSLYLNYSASSYYYNNGTELTDKNILNYRFSCKTNASNGIEDVTYVPGTYSAVGESIPFACYYGSNKTLAFVGTVTFGATDPISVEYNTSGTTPVTFSSYDFTNAALTSGYLYFGTPSKGTLYRNYANGIGTRVTTYDTFTTSSVSYGSTYSVNTLTYIPAIGYVGEVEIPIYSSSSLLTAQTKGTVKIYVGRSFTDVLGTSSAWAAPYINKLSAQGIVNGTDTGMTKYSPTKTVTYGEALKLIMMAAGYPEQTKTSTHWASGYLAKAYYDGLVSSSAIDLNAEVTRDTIASITAKALGLNYASSVNYGVTAPSDSTNGYVYALYNAGIVNGVNVGAYNYWYGSRSITRAEISKIICMVADYAEAN